MSPMNLTRRPVWLGFIATAALTPLVIFVVYAIYFFAMGYSRPGLSWVGSLAFTYLFGAPVCFAAIVGLGWPWVSTLIRWNKLGVANVCAGSVVIGVVAFAAFKVVVAGLDQLTIGYMLRLVGTGSLIGLISGLIFCAVAGVPMRSRN